MSNTLQKLYGKKENNIIRQMDRYNKLSAKFENTFGTKPTRFFSSPGRTELSGNHTDHNHGKVIAASVNLDSIAAVSHNYSNIVVVSSEGYKKPFIVNLDVTRPVKQEKVSTTALIRGIAAKFKDNGYSIGGFNAYVSSDVLKGSGLSSSASIEVLIGTIFNHLFNKGKVPAKQIAMIGQYAENKYFGKPCGLMDQLACAVGGIISIDFANINDPEIKKVNFDFAKCNYALLFIHTGGSHINLTDDYADIPKEMKEVSIKLGKKYCNEVRYKDFLNNIGRLRKKISDRSLLRAFHFLKETDRVKNQIAALTKNDFSKFLSLVTDSGNSSFKYLQNVYSSNDIHFQPLSLALALSEVFIEKLGEGACRVHGGGFEGTVQVFIPNTDVDKFQKFVNKLSPDFKVLNLSIRNIGTTEVIFNL